jgi:glycosyltransferase involved in cell wall biosynthesis
MKVLHVVKTSEGAPWAALQAREQSRHGIEAHVALPERSGLMVQFWKNIGCYVHFQNCCLPLSRPWSSHSVFSSLVRFIKEVNPDVIHSHNVTTTFALRVALRHNFDIPRIFQVPGPLHLEHRLYGAAEIMTAGSSDYWIGSSRYITNSYRRYGVPANRVFLSYYGLDVPAYFHRRTNELRARLGIAETDIVVGNANFIYPPKYHLGQRVGLKCHEDVIDALGLVMKHRRDVVGVLLGGTWGHRTGYEQSLRRRAERVGRGRIYMTGTVPIETVFRVWPDFDIAVHVPLTENCGGVVEPLLATVPVIASSVGGLPEIVVPGLTGQVVQPRCPSKLAEAVLLALNRYDSMKEMANSGRQLVTYMFDVRRTAAEIIQIYRYVLGESTSRPAEFDSRHFLNQVLSTDLRRSSEPVGT